ncbi:MAG: hypothetical protein IKH21_00620 [Clostridia bacterium]|nr:hypothetical protein [Clostridia bacterium]
MKVKSFAFRQKVKSKAHAFDEIVHFAHDEMKSVLHPAKRDFIALAISPTKGGFHPSAGQISLKKARFCVRFSGKWIRKRWICVFER